MEAIEALREQLAYAHYLVEQCLEDLTPDQLHQLPAGRARTIAGVYAQGLAAEDRAVQSTLQQKEPLATTTWNGKQGLSALPPPGGSDPTDWARSVRVDLPALRGYAQDVYTASDEYLGSLSPEDLDRELDIGGGRMQSLNWVLFAFVIGRVTTACGEIAAVRRAQGLAGYPVTGEERGT